jgi:hypothetical protein
MLGHVVQAGSFGQKLRDVPDGGDMDSYPFLRTLNSDIGWGVFVIQFDNCLIVAY